MTKNPKGGFTHGLCVLLQDPIPPRRYRLHFFWCYNGVTRGELFLLLLLLSLAPLGKAVEAPKAKLVKVARRVERVYKTFADVVALVRVL